LVNAGSFQTKLPRAGEGRLEKEDCRRKKGEGRREKFKKKKSEPLAVE